MVRHQHKPRNTNFGVMQVKNPHGELVPPLKVNPVGEIGYDGDKIAAIRSLRDDPLDHFHDRHQIGNAQFEAGKRYRSLLEAAQVGRIRSQDMTLEPVDGGGHLPEIMTDRQLKAIKQLNAIDEDLGYIDAKLIQMMLGQRMWPNEIAETQFWQHVASRIGIETSRRQVQRVSSRIREALGLLASIFQLAPCRDA